MIDISSSQVGQENIDASPFVSIVTIIEFLDKHLPNFPNFLQTSVKSIAELRISEVLCPFLNTRPNKDEVSLFTFEREVKNENSEHSSDFVAIDVNQFEKAPFPLKPMFTIEAKRLPTDKEGKGREKEYVKGKLGGIERYKRGHHGSDLPESAMVGYVQKETCSHWHAEINRWINELIQTNAKVDIIWNKDDLLIHSDDFDKVKKYVSVNKREKDSIKLHHYLMELV
jgi:hypothetical protein